MGRRLKGPGEHKNSCDQIDFDEAGVKANDSAACYCPRDIQESMDLPVFKFVHLGKVKGAICKNMSLR